MTRDLFQTADHHVHIGTDFFAGHSFCNRSIATDLQDLLKIFHREGMERYPPDQTEQYLQQKVFEQVMSFDMTVFMQQDIIQFII